MGVAGRPLVDPRSRVALGDDCHKIGGSRHSRVMNDADAFSAMYEREGERVLVFLSRRTFDVELAGGSHGRDVRGGAWIVATAARP